MQRYKAVDCGTVIQIMPEELGGENMLPFLFFSELEALTFLNKMLIAC